MSRMFIVYLISFYNLCAAIYNTYVYSTWHGGGAGVRMALLILGIMGICCIICVLMGLYREIVWCLRASFVFVVTNMAIVISTVMAHAGVTNLLIGIFNLVLSIWNGYVCALVIINITNRRNVQTVPAVTKQSSPVMV